MNEDSWVEIRRELEEAAGLEVRVKRRQRRRVKPRMVDRDNPFPDMTIHGRNPPRADAFMRTTREIAQVP